MSGPKEFEIVVAEMETRLRGMMLKIMRPMLDQVRDLEEKLDDVSKRIEEHEELMVVAETLRGEVQILSDQTKVMADDLRKGDTKFREFEHMIAGEVVMVQGRSAELTERLEEHSVELSKHTREVARTWEEAERLQKQHDASMNSVWEASLKEGRMNQKAREEIMEHVRLLQRQREELMDELWGDGKGIVRIDKQLSQMSDFIKPLPNLKMELDIFKDHLSELNQQQDSCLGFCDKMAKDVTEFGERTDMRLKDMKAEFKESTDRLIAHHAMLMKGIRNDYAEELTRARDLRVEIEAFQKDAKEQQKALAECVESDGKRIDALHFELATDIEEAHKRQRKDHIEASGDMQQLRQNIEGHADVIQATRISLEFLSRIMGLVLEGEKVASAMHIQDFADRSAEYWLGAAQDASRQPPPSHTADVLEQQRASQQKNAPNESDSLIQLDWRKGFARLGYLPGQVTFRGARYEKQDILLMHHKLLQKAQAAYEKGPPQLSGAPPAAPSQAVMSQTSPGTAARRPVTLQPGAVGGTAGGAGKMGVSTGRREYGELLAAPELRTAASVVVDRKTQASEDRKAASPSTKRILIAQRPGSQDQPEAVGSRGSMFGPVGATSQEGATSLKLPAISAPRVGKLAVLGGSLTAR